MLFTQTPDNPDSEQPLLTHLIELRSRLLRMVIAILAVVALLVPFANDLYLYIATPLMAHLPTGNTMIATQVVSPFLTPFKLALIAAVFLAMPYLLYQLWAFVAPGLYQHEKRFAVPLLISSIFLFYLGVAFAYYIVFPIIFTFMAATTPTGVAMMTDINAYLDFVLTLFFAFGVSFEVPVATVLLVLAGITTPENLVNQRPYVIVGAFVIGMVLTPPDVFSQTLLAVPLWLLFELGVFLARLLLRQQETSSNLSNNLSASTSLEKTTSVYSDQSKIKARSSTQQANNITEKQKLELTDPELEAEVDHQDAAELHAAQVTYHSMDEKIRLANRLREIGNLFAARQVLYEILEAGTAEQRVVARNILCQLDQNEET